MLDAQDTPDDLNFHHLLLFLCKFKYLNEVAFNTISDAKISVSYIVIEIILLAIFLHFVILYQNQNVRK